jgi:hypothetical protein
VVSSAFAVGFLTAPFATPVTPKFLGLCGLVLLVQGGVGLLGFYFHIAANLRGLSPHWQENFIQGAPALAPLLFPNLVLLAGIGLWALREHLPPDTPDRAEAGDPSMAIAKEIPVVEPPRSEPGQNPNI